MGTRVSYPTEVKMKAIEMRLQGVPEKQVMDELHIKNRTQINVWLKWHREDQLHRLEQPVGKQYTYGKSRDYKSEVEKLEAEIHFLHQQIDLLKKFKMWERMWKKR